MFRCAGSHQPRQRHDAWRRLRRIDTRQTVGDAVFQKLDNAELGCSGHSFVTAAFVQHQETNIGIIGIDLFATFSHDDFDIAFTDLALQEHVLHLAVRANALAVHHGILWPDLGETTGFYAREVSLPPGLCPDTLDRQKGSRRQVEGQPGHRSYQRNEQPK